MSARSVFNEFDTFWFSKTHFLGKLESEISENRSKISEKTSIFDLACALKSSQMVEKIKFHLESTGIALGHPLVGYGVDRSPLRMCKEKSVPKHPILEGGGLPETLRSGSSTILEHRQGVLTRVCGDFERNPMILKEIL